MTPRAWGRMALHGLVVGSLSHGSLAGAAASASAQHPPAIRVEFDYSAAELLAGAIERPSLSEAEAEALLPNRRRGPDHETTEG